MKVIIYATHSFGTFETLKQHPDIVILGYGTTWKGFLEKAKVIHAYLQTLPNEIVCIVDGFDSYIKKTNGLEEEFLKMDCKVLVSVNDHQIIPIKIIDDYITQKVFTNCKNNEIANSGLMMGYVDELKIVWNKIIHGPTNDDQGNLNKVCNELPFLKIDVNHVIFQNCSTMEEIEKSSAYICQKPGTLSFSRISRAIFEYSPYFIPEILFILCIGYFIYNRRKMIKLINKKIHHFAKK